MSSLSWTCRRRWGKLRRWGSAKPNRKKELPFTCMQVKVKKAPQSKKRLFFNIKKSPFRKDDVKLEKNTCSKIRLPAKSAILKKPATMPYSYLMGSNLVVEFHCHPSCQGATLIQRGSTWWQGMKGDEIHSSHPENRIERLGSTTLIQGGYTRWQGMKGDNDNDVIKRWGD